MANLLTDMAAGAAGIVGRMTLGGLAAHVVFGVVTAGLLKAPAFAENDER